MRYPNPSVSPILINSIGLDSSENIISIDYQIVSLNLDDDAGLIGKQTTLCLKQENCAKSVESFLKPLFQSPDRIKVKNLKYFDLLADFHYCNGVYIFFTSDEKGDITVEYIGKTTSRAVVDRMGSHLDLRDDGFLNCLIKRIAKHKVLGFKTKGLRKHASTCCMNAALESRFTYDTIGEMFFCFIPVYQASCCKTATYPKLVGKLETLLIRSYKDKASGEPTYNY